MVYTADLKSAAERHTGSSPVSRTILKHIVLGCDLVHQKSLETEAVCFNMVRKVGLEVSIL